MTFPTVLVSFNVLWIRRINVRGRRALSSMLRAKDLAFVKALASPALLMELRISGPDSPITIPYNSSATPDVLDVVITRDLPTSVVFTSSSALISDHFPVLIDSGCRPFDHPPDRPDARCTDWATFQTHMEAEIPINPELHSGTDIDACVENLSGAILGALAASTPQRRLRGDSRPQIPKPSQSSN